VSNFFENLPYEGAQQLEQLSRLAFDLRENRAQVLQRHGVDSDEALLRLVHEGAVPEHPGYDDYLGVRVLEATREAVRSRMQAVVRELAG
jgi:hypothetical protein